MDHFAPCFKDKRQAVVVHIPHREWKRHGQNFLWVNDLNPVGVDASPKSHAICVVAVIPILCSLRVDHLRVVGVGKPVGISGAVCRQELKRHVLKGKRVRPIPATGLLVGHPVREGVALRVEVRGLQGLGSQRGREGHGRHQKNADCLIHVSKVG